MAVETVHSPNSPNINRTWKRISTGRLSFLYSEEKILPNYLRSPTGSCHDVCKFGRKHEESENKPRVSPLKRVNRSFSGSLNFDSPLRKKALTKSMVNSSFGSEICDSLGGSDHAKSEVPSFFSRDSDVKKTKMVSTKGKKKKMVYISPGRALSRSKEMVEHNRRVTALKLKSVAQKAAIALRRSTRKKTNGEAKSAEPKKVVKPFRVSMSSDRCSRCVKTNKESSSLRVPIRKNRKHVDEKCKELVEEKTLYVIKIETDDKFVKSDQKQRCGIDSPIHDPKSEKSQDEAKCIEAVADDVKKSQDKDECIETKAGDEKKSQDELECIEVEAGDESYQEEEDENMSNSEGKNTRQGKSKALSTAVNDKSMKLRINRRKVVDSGSQGNSPRKLKFKRGKVITRADTTSKSEVRRLLKTNETNFSNDKEQQHHPTVVLKHQETHKNTDSEVLSLNNVIEETANKLVETRKSKVKALVGAFESVISQERTSSTTT